MRVLVGVKVLFVRDSPNVAWGVVTAAPNTAAAALSFVSNSRMNVSLICLKTYSCNLDRSIRYLQI